MNCPSCQAEMIGSMPELTIAKIIDSYWCRECGTTVELYPRHDASSSPDPLTIVHVPPEKSGMTE